jgi:dihydrodipicolinate synthase/N-acetylneuraminate lyase
MKRRSLIKGLAVGALTGIVCRGAAETKSQSLTPSTGLTKQLTFSRHINDRLTVAEYLKGPIQSFRTSFNEDGSIDYDGVRNFVDHCIAGGSKTILLTAGDSHLTSMTNEEIARLTRTVCEHTSGRAMVVAADRNSRTATSMEFAQYARSVGASVLMCQPPTWAKVSAASMAEHYVKVSENLLVMIVTNVFESDPAIGIEAIQTAIRKSEKVVAIKDDIFGELGAGVCKIVRGTGAVLFAGGLMKNHLWLLQRGCGTCYMSTFLVFAPQIKNRYWELIKAGDLNGAQAMVAEYETPFFDFLSALSCGWNAGMHGTLAIHGIIKRWLPKPYLSASDESMDQLRDFLRRKSLL